MGAPTDLKIQLCDVDRIDVEFRGCGLKVPFVTEGNGMFTIAPPKTFLGRLQYRCYSGSPSFGPYFTVNFENPGPETIQVPASCSNPLYNGQSFGTDGEASIIGSRIE